MSPSLRVAPQAFCCPQFSRSDVGHAVLCQSHETDMVLIDLCGCSKRKMMAAAKKRTKPEGVVREERVNARL